ncbi:hypothetical protein V8C42DRAFT_360017 [Trichoderma barbatum]
METKYSKSDVEVLRKKLGTILGLCSSDALMVYYSGLYDSQRKRYEHDKASCLNLARRRALKPFRPVWDKASDSGVSELYRFHSETIQPLVKLYLEPVNNGLGASDSSGAVEASTPSDEKTARIGQAFYRLQFACNLYGRYIYVKDKPYEEWYYPNLDMIREFLQTLEPTERADLADVYRFVRNQYDEFITSARNAKTVLMESVGLRKNGLVNRFVTRGLDAFRRSYSEGFDPKQIYEIDREYFSSAIELCFVDFLDVAL